MKHVYNFKIFKLTFSKSPQTYVLNLPIDPFLITLIDLILFQVRANVSPSRQSRPILFCCIPGGEVAQTSRGSDCVLTVLKST